ncbi:MAG: hypothetical protein M3R72_00660 [Bacteroidota bacterium]|nr:hypothetical protein [Bacteroidota bacterium]
MKVVLSQLFENYRIFIVDCERLTEKVRQFGCNENLLLFLSKLQGNVTLQIMDENLQALIFEIQSSEASLIYASYLNLFKYIRAPFCKFEVSVEHTYLYRVRAHLEGDGNYFLDNINKLSFRQDIPNIRDFGRCNEPLQSRFYASDDQFIALTEICNKVIIEHKKETVYYTLSVWKFNDCLIIAPIFEPDNVNIENPNLTQITKKCFETIQANDRIPIKHDLKDFLKGVAEEFAKPISPNSKAYLFSAAYSNYLFNSTGEENEKIDGIVYPTCVDKSNARGLGLNYVLNNSVIGFDSKIEFFGAHRLRLDKTVEGYKEVERIINRGFDKSNGRIEW